MADQDRPNQNANKSKAEGDRYPAGEREGTGGITNRPMSEEVDNQEELPERGTHKDRTANPGSTRREGDFAEDER